MLAILDELQRQGVLPYVIGVAVPVAFGSVIALVARRLGWTS
jgi:hypothetical protein